MASMCQCPISGSRHFYSVEDAVKLVNQAGVNALSRAHVISTARLHSCR